MGPANRQAVVRWIRDVRKPSPPPLSPYLQKAAVYSDKAGSEIIMAIDLDGVFSYQRISKYLKSKESRLKEWEADLDQLAKLLDTVQGVRIGVRIGEEPSGMDRHRLDGDASIAEPYAKQLILQIMSDRGGAINDVYSWTAKAKGNEISLAGKLSKTGLRRLMSVIDSPATDTGNDAEVSPGEEQATMAKASLKHYRAVAGIFDNLKSDMKDIKTVSSTAVWFDRYAKRIEKMPVLNVDEELLQYSAFVAHQFRQASLAVKTMGIQSGVRQAQITSSGGNGTVAITPTADTATALTEPYGGRDIYGTGEVKAVGAERRVVRAEEKSIAATDVQQIRQTIIAATADIRRKMTQEVPDRVLGTKGSLCHATTQRGVAAYLFAGLPGRRRSHALTWRCACRSPCSRLRAVNPAKTVVRR